MHTHCAFQLHYQTKVIAGFPATIQANRQSLDTTLPPQSGKSPEHPLHLDGDAGGVASASVQVVEAKGDVKSEYKNCCEGEDPN